jgi:hypothetical protein
VSFLVVETSLACSVAMISENYSRCLSILRVFTQPGSNSEVGKRNREVRFTPNTGHYREDQPCPKSANRRHVRRFAPKFCTGEPLELLDRISVAEFLTSAPDAGSGLRRRLRPEVSKTSSTALSSNEGELVRSITTCAPARLRMRHVLDSENGPDTDVGLVERRAGDEGFDGH